MDGDYESTPLWKQLLGAAVGGAIALGIYAGYSAAAPHLPDLMAYVIPPQAFVETTSSEPLRIAEEDIGEEKEERLMIRAERRAEEMEQRKQERDDSHALAALEQMNNEEALEEEEMEEMVIEDIDIVPLAPPPPINENLAVPSEAAMLQETPALSSSGVGEWVAVLLALSGTVALAFRRKMKELGVGS